MPSDTDSSSQSLAHPRWKDWLAVPLLLGASLLILAAGYFSYHWPGMWQGGASPLSWSGAVLELTQGQGYKGSKALTIDALGEKEVAVAAVVTKTFRASDYSSVVWNVTGIQPGAEFAFLWRTAEHPAQLFSHALVASKDGVTPVDMLDDKNWRGQIVGLALAVKGRLNAPITLNAVSVRPVSATQILERLGRQWLATNAWDARSINFADAKALLQDIPLLHVVSAAVLLSIGLYLLLGIAHLLHVRAAILCAFVFVGWLALDMRWQWILFNQLHLTAQQYSGKSWEEKHLASEDAALFTFMRKVSATLPPASRILYLSDHPFSRGKGAYYLYPHNVFAGSDFMLAASRKAGDYIVVFAKKGVQYDASQRLVVADGASVAADLLLSADENFLLRVR